jgi:hypothetical protein
MNLLHTKIVDSSVISVVIYDVEEEVLAIQFLSGSVWIYFDVSLEVYDELISAKSVGNYFNHHIRNFYASKQYLTASEWNQHRRQSFHA